jgi:ubiquitin C-terminal hydrolase
MQEVDDMKEINLEDMFTKFRSPETLECRCSKCGGSDNKIFTQQTELYILPKYLIITLGRFKTAVKAGRGRGADRWWAHKIKTKVKFPINGSWLRHA